MPYGQYNGLRLLSQRSDVSERLAKHRARQGLHGFANKPSANAKPSRPAATSAKNEKPVQAVVESTKARAAAVMASQAFKGRERQGEELLIASCARNAKIRSSAQIVAELSKRCSDAELARRRKAFEQAKATAQQAEISASWERAFANLGWNS